MKKEKRLILKSIFLFLKNSTFFSVSLLHFGYLINTIVGEDAAGIFLGIYPILAYTVFIWESRNYTLTQSTKGNKLSSLLLLVILVGIISIFYFGFKENEIVFDNNQIEINGMYGKKIQADELEIIQLLEKTPKIKYRSNGFALGTIRKGYFKTIDGEKVLLVLNSSQKPLIFIKTKSESKIYFSAKEHSNTEIFKSLKNTFPNTQ